MANPKVGQRFSIRWKQKHADGTYAPIDLSQMSAIGPNGKPQVPFSWLTDPAAHATIQPSPDEPSFARVWVFGTPGHHAFTFTALGRDGSPIFSQGHDVVIDPNPAEGEPEFEVMV